MELRSTLALTVLLNTVFFFTGCIKKSKPDNPINDFANIKEITLKGSEIKLENDSVLYDPRTIDVFDSLAVFYDNNGYTAFSLINLKSGKLVKRFAETGSGDYKFNINSVGLSRVRNSSNEFTVYEASAPYRLFKYNLDKLLTSESYHPYLVCKLPAETYFINPIMQTDSTIIGNIGFSKLDNKVFGIWNLNNNKLTTGVDLTKSPDARFKEFYYDENIGWTKTVLRPYLAFRPMSEQVASFSTKGALFQIFETTNDNPKILSEKLYYLPEFNILDLGNKSFKSKLTANNRYGYNNIAVTKDFIYTLFNGKPSESSNLDVVSTNIILVYDWNGTPVKKIILDKDCFQIAIDPQNPKTLFTLTAFKNIGIRKFTLND
ncbi:BF3164 family lipoprotein [Pedobacter gandavensis]|uniref:BF3164 family lipoprotein n=1 Tax=Pedobacter gandavensis TaxID=2679963 RepID=UPI00292EF100|nr:BF3164 family lipoprotein [Pedobacter gandavensis]